MSEDRLCSDRDLLLSLARHLRKHDVGCFDPYDGREQERAQVLVEWLADAISLVPVPPREDAVAVVEADTWWGRSEIQVDTIANLRDKVTELTQQREKWMESHHQLGKRYVKTNEACKVAIDERNQARYERDAALVEIERLTDQVKDAESRVDGLTAGRELEQNALRAAAHTIQQLEADLATATEVARRNKQHYALCVGYSEQVTAERDAARAENLLLRSAPPTSPRGHNPEGRDA